MAEHGVEHRLDAFAGRARDRMHLGAGRRFELAASAVVSSASIVSTLLSAITSGLSPSPAP